MRKSVEHNAYELVCAMCLIDPYATKETILNANLCDYPRLKGCNEYTFKKYQDDLIKRNHIDKYIHNFHTLKISDIDCVFLEGKTSQSPEIIQLNQTKDRKQCKADVYLRTTEGEYVGLSVKQNKLCTKTNFSVEKMLGELCGHSLKHELSSLRRKLLIDHGFHSHDKSKRPFMNALFYPNRKNEYWDSIRKYIQLYEKVIKEHMVKHMYPIDLPYPLYEFDGEQLKLLKVDINSIYFAEHPPFYLDSNGKSRNAAKLFYLLVVNDESYRVEIRWKGNIHNSSPQFLTHLNA